MDDKFLKEVKETMLRKYKLRKDPPWIVDKTIFLTIHGSQAYGLARPESDFDIGGICIPPKQYFYGFLHNFEQAQSTNPDGAVYGIKKYLQLASDANPNVMELLWIDPKFWLITSKTHEVLVKNRSVFLSTKVKHTYSGYAHAQLNRIRVHYKWLSNPPHKPTREEFGLPPNKLLTTDQKGALNRLIEEGMEVPENFMDRLQKENEYDKAVKDYQHYQTWKETRNEARADLEKLHGYDTKHAMHLVRLMRQCREILTTGTLNVLRKDRDELLDIRNGAWTYPKLVAWADQEEQELEHLAYTSKLPQKPNREWIDMLCQEIVEKSFNE